MARMDGWITIGTKLDNSEFDKQIAKLENQIEKEEQKSQLKFEVSQQAKNELEKHGKKLDDLSEKYNKLLQAKQRYEEISSKLSGEKELEPLQYIQYSAELPELQKMLSDKTGEFGKFYKLQDQLAKAVSEQENLEIKVGKTNLEYENSINKVDELKSKINEIDMKRIKKENDDIQKGLSGTATGVVKNFEKIGRSVSRTILGIFGIRTALSLLSRASSQLASYDDKYKADLDYIQFALTQVVAPVLRGIVNLMATFLQYVNYIAQAWFGINLFSKGSAKDFKSIKGSAEGIKKALQTTPFDEMNILNEDGSVGGGTGFTMPDFDLSKIEGKVPEWIEWIARHKNEVIAGLLGIAGALVAIKLGIDPIKALGIGLFIVGITEALMALKDYMENPTFKNFGKIIKGIGLAIIGLGVVIGGLPVIITGVVVTILGIVVQYWEEIKTKLQEGIDWLESKGKWVEENFGLLGKAIYDTFVYWLKFVLNEWDININTWKKLFDEFINFIQAVFAGDWQRAWESLGNMANIAIDGIKEHFMNIFDFIKITFETWINTIIDGINTITDIASTLGGALGFSIPKLEHINITGNNIVNPNSNTGSAVTNQALSNMAEVIGQNVTINASINNNMNGKLISRVLDQVRTETAFAMNR